MAKEKERPERFIGQSEIRIIQPGMGSKKPDYAKKSQDEPVADEG